MTTTTATAPAPSPPKLGGIELQIPKIRASSFLTTVLEPRRQVDQAIYSVIMQTYIGGVSTRKVDAALLPSLAPRAASGGPRGPASPGHRTASTSVPEPVAR